MFFWVVAVAINCAEPRIPFREFYEQAYGRFPNHPGEQIAPVMSRVANSTGSYADYAATYRDKCGK